MTPTFRTLHCLMVCFTYASAVVQLSPCVDDGGSEKFAEVKQSSATSFYCSEFTSTDTVVWNIVPDSPPNVSNDAGSCDSVGTCSQGVFGPSKGFTATRPTSTSSTMTINTTVTGGTADVVQTGSLLCGVGSQTSKCKMDLITAASSQDTTCTITFDPTTWRTSGRCDINAATWSSRQRYYCRWYKTKIGSIESGGTKVDYTSSNKRCSFGENIPADDGEYSYRVKVTPGDTNVTASFNGTNQIRRPSKTSVTGCVADYVEENTTVTCTCSTNNIGLPNGSLKWNVSNDNNAPSGNTGVTPLLMSRVLLRSDHMTTQFRCDVIWKTAVMGDVFSFNVGYKPEKLVMSLNKENALEGDDVTVTCKVEGRPMLTLILTKAGGSNPTSHNNSLTYVLSNVTCRHAGLYRCDASNRFGNDYATKRLYVNCKPRSDVTTLPTILFNSQAATSVFDLEAYPIPTTFTFAGPEVNGTTIKPSYSGLNETVTCTNKNDDVDFLFRCTVTVYNVTSQASGVYMLRVDNGVGYNDYRINITSSADGFSGKTTEEGMNVGPIVGGIVGAVAIIIIIIGVIVFVMRRRRNGPTKSRIPGNPTSGSRSAGRRAGGYAEMEGPGTQMGSTELLQGASHISHQPLSFAPAADVYAQVNKSKNTKPLPANCGVAAAEAEGVVGGDEYAVVTKDKKADKAKAAAKLKANKKKAGKGKKKGNQPDGDANTYENFAQRGNNNAQAVPAQPAQDDGPHKNDDGLVYADLQFKPNPTPKPKKPDPSDNVEYGQLDFKRMEQN